MKLKLKKTFNPAPIDDGDELYPNGIFVFNITKMVGFLMQDPERFQVERVSVSELYESSGLDEETIKTADLTKPIVLAEIAPGGFNVIDGNHRVEKARRLGVKELPAYRVGPGRYHRFLTTYNGYKAHVEHWNEKLRSSSRQQPVPL